jgi:hypothetical protein
MCSWWAARVIEAPPSGRVSDTHQLLFFHYYKELSENEGEVRTQICENSFLFSGDPFSNSNLAVCARFRLLASHGMP